MVVIADIHDKDGLKEWLGDQPYEVSIWIARRTALRHLPFYWQWVAENEQAKKRNMTALSVLRFYLTSEVARSMPTSENKAVVVRAAAAAHVAAKGVFDAPAYVAADTSITTQTAAINASHAAKKTAAVAEAADIVADADKFAAIATTAAVTARATGVEADEIAATEAAITAAFDADDARVSNTDVAMAAAISPIDGHGTTAWKAFQQDYEYIAGYDQAKMAELPLDTRPLWNNTESSFQQEWDTLKINLLQTSLTRSDESALASGCD